jgi:Flp pilus assembly protein TadD
MTNHPCLSSRAMPCRSLLVTAPILAALALAGCVSPPSRIDAAAEQRAASNPRAMLHIADAAASSGDVTTASSFYQRAVALSPGNADAVLGYARSLVAQNRTPEAIMAIEDALPHADRTDGLRLRRSLGELLVLAHRPSEAVAIFCDALRTTPDAPELLIGLGVALDTTHDFPAAQSAFRRALAIEPNSIAARNDLALSMALQGQTRDALSSLKSLRDQVAEAGGKSSDLATIDGNLALVYAMVGDLHHAGEAGAGATASPDELANNMRFYSALDPAAPVSGALDRSGLPAAAPLD